MNERAKQWNTIETESRSFNDWHDWQLLTAYFCKAACNSPEPAASVFKRSNTQKAKTVIQERHRSTKLSDCDKAA